MPCSAAVRTLADETAQETIRTLWIRENARQGARQELLTYPGSTIKFGKPS